MSLVLLFWLFVTAAYAAAVLMIDPPIGAPFLVLVIGWFILRAVGRHRQRRADAARQHRRRTTLEALYALHPEVFEVEVARILAALGWSRVRVKGGSGDRGVDIVGTDPEGARTVVQCKRFAPTLAVGSPVVQAVLGAQSIEGADRAMVVTTSYFTPSARQLAALMDVRLVDGPLLALWLQEAARHPMHEEYRGTPRGA